MMSKRLRLPIKEDTKLSALALRVLRAATKRAKAAIIPPKVKSKKGRHSGNLCTMETVISPTIEEQKVASNIGRKTSVGSAAPCCARYIKIVTGKRVREELFRTKNKICALVAVLLSGLRLCKECMARNPIGVAALSK